MQNFCFLQQWYYAPPVNGFFYCLILWYLAKWIILWHLSIKMAICQLSIHLWVSFMKELHTGIIVGSMSCIVDLVISKTPGQHFCRIDAESSHLLLLSWWMSTSIQPAPRSSSRTCTLDLCQVFKMIACDQRVCWPYLISQMQLCHGCHCQF